MSPRARHSNWNVSQGFYHVYLFLLILYFYFFLQLKAYIIGDNIHDEIVDFIVHVVDQNDNKPVFTQKHFLGIVSDASKIGSLINSSRHSKIIFMSSNFHDPLYPFTIGFEFMTISATDADDPNTDNADIRYSIITQTPPEPSASMFEIDPISGVIRVNAEGLDSKVKSQIRFLNIWSCYICQWIVALRIWNIIFPEML